MAALPQRIQVGCHTFDVQHSDIVGDRGANGETYPERLVMQISTQMAASREREVVLHELLHACWHQTSLRTEEDAAHEHEERVIAALAPVLLSVLRTNPELVEFFNADD